MTSLELNQTSELRCKKKSYRVEQLCVIEKVSVDLQRCPYFANKKKQIKLVMWWVGLHHKL